MPVFADLLVRWQRTHGRAGLPWQGQRDPYRVWLSEIMLQQTQVATVLDYYPRFLARFPTVADLAAGSLDDVLALWSGLGYYSRARNLHRCAVDVMALHAGEFPRSAERLTTLPGVGRSTAAAIAAFCFDERAAILDGNVKRVLTRLLAFGEDLSSARHERQLWEHAAALLPPEPGDMPVYTQALMDLGATVCTLRAPACARCPAAGLCRARQEGAPERYPVKTRKLRRSAESLWLLRAHSGDAVWLEKRPATGVWAGLYCLPVFGSRDELGAAIAGHRQPPLRDAAPFVHVLTHKDLHLHPVEARLPRVDLGRPGGAWFGAADWPRLGLPAPVRRLLEGALAEVEFAVPAQGEPAVAESGA